MEVSKNDTVYKNKKFKYEVCVKDSLSKEIAVKSVSQEWLEENIAIEYWEYIQRHEQSKGWFIVSRDDAVDESKLMKSKPSIINQKNGRKQSSHSNQYTSIIQEVKTDIKLNSFDLSSNLRRRKIILLNQSLDIKKKRLL